MPSIKTIATGSAIAAIGMVAGVAFLHWARANDIQPFAEWTETFQGL